MMIFRRLPGFIVVTSVLGMSILAGCSHSSNVTQSSQTQQAKEQAASYQNNPNMPPQARAAAMGMMNGENQMAGVRAKDRSPAPKK
jgi:outer membrane murein-binding lipoprotein Lpp